MENLRRCYEHLVIEKGQKQPPPAATFVAWDLCICSVGLSEEGQKQPRKNFAFVAWDFFELSNSLAVLRFIQQHEWPYEMKYLFVQK